MASFRKSRAKSRQKSQRKSRLWPAYAAGLAMAFTALTAVDAEAQTGAPAIASVDVNVRGTQQRDGPAGGVTAHRFAVGEQVVICFTPSHDGFVSVWAKETDAPDVTRIFPNRYAGVDRAGLPVESGVEHCIGQSGDGFSLRAQEPIGVTEITVAWTARETEQLTPDMFANPTAHSGVMALGTARMEVTR